MSTYSIEKNPSYLKVGARFGADYSDIATSVIDAAGGIVTSIFNNKAEEAKAQAAGYSSAAAMAIAEANKKESFSLDQNTVMLIGGAAIILLLAGGTLWQRTKK